jgi:N-acetylglucosaminyldiphosphoundecaprenol N-acetyl-beta-D-mannosaminyltransferase
MGHHEDILGYPVDTRGVTECVGDVLSWVQAGNGTRWLACLNPHSYALALDDRTFSNALRAADWLVPDGVGVVIASYWLKGRIRQRITGSDIFWGVQRGLNQLGSYSVFFLGAADCTLATIRERMARDFPALRVAGTYSPPFKATYTVADTESMLSAINAVAPDVLWVGMTAPKQEKWIFDNRARLNVRFIGAVGAVFDFYAGRIRRSHPAFQKLGLEWLPRLIQEPRRLWRRMFISAPLFAWHVLRHRFLSSPR